MTEFYTMRIAILDDYFNIARDLADWSKLDGRADIEVFTKHLGSQENVAKALVDFDIIVGMRERTPFPATLIRRLPKLKLLVTTGMRNRSFDMEAARAQGITVCGTETGRAQGNTVSGTKTGNNSTAELAVGMMITLMRDIHGQFDSMRQGGWQTRPGHCLAGKTLGLLGLGRLGGVMAAAGNVFNMEVIAWSQNLTDRRAAECNTGRVEKDELFRRSDVLSIHLILSDRTRGIVGARELGLMLPTAYLINTSRGPVVDEAALISALDTGAIRGAGLDVFSTEPLAKGHRLWDYENVIVTPHCSAVYAGWDLKSVEMFSDNLTRYREGQTLSNIVDPARGY